MTSYFKQLYCRKECFDVKDMKHYLYNPKEICFATAAKEFQMIEDNGINVVVCWRNSFELMQQLLEKGPSYILIKKLSKYMVNINKTDFKSLLDMGVVSEKKRDSLLSIINSSMMNISACASIIIGRINRLLFKWK